MGIGIDTIVDSGREPLAGPLEKLQNIDFKKYLAELIAGLCHKESLVLTLYYNEELNLKEIGEVLGVSESRVSQIHSQAMLKLKARISDFDVQ